MNDKDLTSLIRDELFSLPNEDATLREQDLASKFGVSRTSVREALKRLASENLIEQRRNMGTRLRHFSAKEISEIYDLRALLEGYACRMAAMNATADEIAEMRRLDEAFQRFPLEESCRLNRIQADDAFHRYIIHLTGNTMLTNMLENFSFLRRVFSVYNKNSLSFRRMHYTHAHIIKAIEQHQAAKAERLMREHCLSAKRKLLEQYTKP